MKKIILVFSFVFIAIMLLGLINAQGCCFNPSNGQCSDNSEEDKCSPFGGEFSANSCSTIQKCQTGCCILGSKTQVTTIAQCDLLSDKFGFQFPDNYRENMNSAECMNINNSQIMGACVTKGALTNENNCEWITEVECKGSFNRDLLCTAKQLNTTCKKTTNTILRPGADEVYFVDSCGNVANIYDSERYNNEDYWTHTYSKANSCGSGLSNANSKTCGNCQYTLSSLGRIADSKTATPTYGKNICVDLSCVENDGTKRANGEAWCTFDSRKEIYLTHSSKTFPIGDVPSGRGLFFYYNGVSVPVGSRFFKQSCVNGKVEVEPCGDYKAERCWHGQCIKNDWEACLDAETKKDCSSLSQCSWYDGEPNCGKVGANSSMWTSDTGFITLGLISPTYKNAEFAYCSEGNSIVPLGTGLSDVQLTALTGGKYTSAAAVAAMSVGTQFTSDTISDFYTASGAGTCYPALPGGFKFWNYAGKKSSKCSSGSQSFTLEFTKDSSYGWLLTLDKSEADYFGMAGFLGGSDIRYWSYFNDADGNLVVGGTIASSLSTILSSGSGSISLNDWHTKGIENACKTISDCDGKSNWLAGKIDQVSSKSKVTGKVIDNSEITGKVTMTGYGVCTQTGKYWYCDGDTTSRFSDEATCIAKGPTCRNTQTTATRSATISSSSASATCKKTGTYTVKCEWSYTCYPWQAPNSGDCAKCGADGLACSEYRCKSLGKNCEYDQAGDGTGYCKSSNDKTPPTITFTKYPTQPVEPYGAVQFEIKTNEVTSCKFDLKENTFDNMSYDFGEDDGNEHSVILYPPAYSKGLDEDLTAYGILKKDGKYTMKVMCSDGVGNIGSNSINFEVMTVPDKKAPKILGFNPVSGSFIKFNTTSKRITMKTDEPVDCKWDTKDQDFKLMKNNFVCDSVITADGLTRGYFCSGIITNITLVLEEETKVYIRCKDQPWLEGLEDNFYQRNAQTESSEYTLRPSQQLKIIGISPAGKTIIGPGEQLQLKVSTYGGAFSGRTNCSFTITTLAGENISRKFSVTDTNLNKNNLSLTDGYYSGEVICKDAAENVVTGTIGFNLFVDRKAPILNKIYEYGKTLKLITNENAMCYYALNKKTGCLQNIENLTLMEGLNKDHNIDWIDGNSYYIKCKDYFGNYDKICGSIIKAY